MAPNADQLAFADLPIAPILALAPAGCGKTEALALRARAAIARGDIASPRKVLALTYSNKAKTNLAARMASCVGPGWRQRIVVTNLHGLAARIIRAHGATVGVPQDVALPEAPRRRRKLRELGINWNNSTPFENALAAAKSGDYDNDEVMARLIASGHETAIAYEKALRADRRLDYDDLIRHAARLMAIPAVARLYQQHFALVLVDEVQDLSMLQYRLVAAVGGDKITFAGDPAQGIYSFAGADPDGVFAAIDAQHPEVVEFKLSYRSSPAVLRAINALATEMQSTQLTCADEHRWADEGHVLSFESHDTDLEAASVLNHIEEVLRDERATVGVVLRRSSRADELRAAARERGIPFEDWALATHVPEVVERLKRAYTQAARQGTTDTEVLHHLSQLCRASLDSDDADTLDELASALEQLEEAMAAGTSLRDALAGCRVSPDPSAPVAPGLHLLTGHKGKGQEFDWVIVLGLEAGHIPDFRNEDDHQVNEELRVLHVMASRARYGLAFTYSRATRTKYGWRDSAPSRWLDLVNSAATERRAS
ncbi:MAG: ATP-dependent helicase [Acidimicrobiales bacterium]|nr:ATP-dependent helicase [Acidimicrobiales bacterium]